MHIKVANQNARRVTSVSLTTTTMSTSASTESLLKEAETAAPKNPAKAEKIYRQILTSPNSGDAEALRDQETALVKLGELFRDQK